MAYRLLLRNMEAYVDIISKKYGWRHGEILLFERLELVSRYGALMEMEQSMFKDEKINVDLLLGAYRLYDIALRS